MVFAQYFLMLSLISNFFICLLHFGVGKILNIKFTILSKLVTFSFFCLTLTFFNYIYLNIISDFSFLIVKNSSNIGEPLFYKICGSWGNHEGSILLWAWLLNLYTVSIVFLKTGFKNFYISYVITYQSIFLIFFNIFILLSSSPFLRLNSLVLNGLQLNPLLQDFSLSIHPPILYLGYLGFSIVFSFILVSLQESFLNKKLLHYINIYTILSWAFLTLGIFLGSWWAYYELGWGGWWFWDPVENISLFPWILTLLFIHFTVLIIKQPKYLILFYGLGLSIFLTIILGIFFVRSGFLTSVHTFAVDPQRGLFLGGFLFFIFVQICFFMYKTPLVKNSWTRPFDAVTVSLYFNVFLVGCFFLFILVGTFSPTFIKLCLQKTFILGAHYFNEICFTFIFIFSFYFLISIQSINYFYICFYNIGCFLSFIFFIDKFDFNLESFSLVLLITILLNIFIYNYVTYFSMSYYLHSLFLVFLILVLCSWFGFFEYFSLLKPGNSFYFLKFLFIFKSYNILNTYNYYTLFGDFLITDWFQTSVLGSAFPEKRFYFIENFSGIKANIISNYFADIYTIIGDGNIINGWYVHLIYHPGMPLIWFLGFSFFVSLIILFKIKYTKYVLKKQQIFLW